MVFAITFIVLFFVNSAVVYLTHYFFPQFVALGTATTTICWAVVQSMGVLSLIDLLVIPLVGEYEKRRKSKFTTKEWMILYFLINTVSIWIIARFALYLGFGISSWRVAVGLGLMLDVVQGVAMMQIEKLRKSK